MNRDILKYWMDAWNNSDGDVFFRECFKETYIDVLEKAEKSKNNNKRFKLCFLLVHVFCVIAFLIIFASVTWRKECIEQRLHITWHWFDALCLLVLFIVLAIWLGAVISKWIDIKKYQETWARHSTHKQLLDTEMLMYCYGLEPYDQVDKNRVFICRIMEIWTQNQNKFKDNMENKEKELMDLADHLKSILSLKK